MEAGRQRGINEDAERLHTLFRQPAARRLAAVGEAMGTQAKALLVQLNAVCKAVDEPAKAVERTFRTHPDAPIMLSFPGIGPGAGARLLAEIGDDRTRFGTAGGLNAYAGAVPITRASGKRKYVGRRFVKYNRLNTPETCGPSPPHPLARCQRPRSAPTQDRPTGTHRPCAICSTVCSDSFTTACCTDATLMKARRFPHPPPDEPILRSRCPVLRSPPAQRSVGTAPVRGGTSPRR